MPIDPRAAIGATLPEHEFEWTTSDVLLYHLALGAGNPPADPRELRYTYERDPQVLPTFGVVASDFHRSDPPSVSFPGVDIDLAKVLHAGQRIDLHRPIPPEGKASSRTRIADVYDKGKAAVILQETVITDAEGPLCTLRSSIFARGEGGFGGERGPSDRVAVPDRDPDLVVDRPTLPQQALLYRLCGDRNPLHADPEFAEAAGFSAPILHGLCTYGVVCKAVVDAVLDGDATKVASYAVRFSGVVFPGETLRVRVWKEGDGRLLVTASVVERDDTPVLSDSTVEVTA
jgi:acyl dehydratase